MATVVKGYEVSDLIVNRKVDEIGLHYEITLKGDSEYVAISLISFNDILKHLGMIDFLTSSMIIGAYTLEFHDFDTERLIFIMRKV